MTPRRLSKREREISAAWRAYSPNQAKAAIDRGIEKYQQKKRLRDALAERQGWRCCYCGLRSLDLTLEHVLPASLGGPDEEWNLAAACMPCNADRASKMWPVHADALHAIGFLTDAEAEAMRVLLNGVLPPNSK